VLCGRGVCVWSQTRKEFRRRGQARGRHARAVRIGSGKSEGDAALL
jgi:hypothetical protein